jgi:uncharacterized protein
MKIVLDTNVLVSGLLSPHQAPGEIVRMISGGTLRLCYDARILAEYRSVLSRSKFGLNQTDVEALLDQIEACGEKAAGKPLGERLPDKFDEPFLEVAIAAQAACLVTGNMKHYPAPFRRGIKVLSPHDFSDYVRGNQA